MALACLIQIDGWDPVAGAAVAIRAASRDDPAVCHLNGQTWWPTVAKLPTLRYDLFDGAFGGQITAPSATLSMAVEPWSEWGRYSLADARFRLWTGELGADWSGYTLRFDGRVTEQPSMKDGQAQVAFAVDDRWLDTAILPTYAGTTGVEGPAGLKGQAKPLSLGAPRYVPGTLIDSINSVFQVSFGPIRTVEAALERLARFGPSAGDYPTYAALVAAPIARGTWATCLAWGLVRFGAPPQGQISFLVQGDVGGPDGWARLPGRLIRRLALLSGGAGKIDDAALATLDAARPYSLSLYLDQQSTARQLIQQLAASVNAVAGVSWTGRLFVMPVGLSAPTITLAADGSALPPVGSVEQVGIAAPWSKLAIGAERAWSVHALSDIAFTAELLDLGAYDPGTTYREGNIVQYQGSSWLYQNPAPTAGNAPPGLPTESNTFWSVLARAGAPGVDGTSPIVTYLTNESFTVPSAPDGTVGAFPVEVSRGQMRVLDGATDVTAQCSFTVQNAFYLDARIGADGSYYAVGLYEDVGYSDLIASYKGKAYNSRLTASKSKAGLNAADITVAASAQAASFSKAGVYVGGDIAFTTTRKNTADTPRFTIRTADGTTFGNPARTAAGHAADFPGSFASTGDDVLIVKGVQVGSQLAGQYGNRFTVTAMISGAQDITSVTRVNDGQDGATGVDGFIADSDVPVFVIECFSNGTAKPSWTGGSGVIRLTKGGSVITGGVTYSIGTQSNIASLTLNGAAFSFAGLTADVGYFVINAIYAGVAYSRVISVKKVRDGSAAFRSDAGFSGQNGSATGGGNTTVPQNRTVTIAGSASYLASTPGASQTTAVRGILGLYWRNVTDDAPLNFLGEVQGSEARSVNRSSNPNEPDIEASPGSVAASFSFTSPSPDKQIAYSAQFRVNGSGGQVNGGVSLEIAG